MRVSECYNLSDNRLAFIAVSARIHIFTRACIYSSRKYARRRASREMFQTTRRETSIDSPACRRFLGELPLRHFGQAARTYHVQLRSDDMKFPLWKSTFVRQM